MQRGKRWGRKNQEPVQHRLLILFAEVCGSVGDVGQQGDLAGALDGLGQLTLMHGAGAGGAPGQDLAPLRGVAAQLGGVLVVDALHLVHAEGADLAALAAAGADILLCKADAQGRVSLSDLMEQLGARQIDSILLEGGSSLAFSALEAGIVRKVQAYIAPKLIGGADAKTPVGGEGFSKMADALALQNLTVTPLGEDFLLEGDLPCSPASSKK